MPSSHLILCRPLHLLPPIPPSIRVFSNESAPRMRWPKYWTSLVAQRLKRLPDMWETSVRSLGWEDPLEKEMATHSSTLAWRILWREEPGRLQFMGLQRVGHDWATSLSLSLSMSLTMLKPLTMWITTHCGKLLKRWEYQTTLPVFWETCMQDKKQQLELNMKQQTGSKLEKEYVKAVYCHHAYLTSVKST